MSKFFNSIKSFMHSISTSDHYASYDPSRQPGQEDTAPLASNEDRRSSSSSLGNGYVPGMRSAQFSSSSTNLASGADSASEPNAASGNRDTISLSDFAPIPSPELSWNRIDTWIEQNYPELFDQLLEGATTNDLNDFEHDLDCILPADVRESYRIHDGQERGAMPTGIFFGVALLDLEQISEEWNIWKKTALHVDELAHRSKAQASKASSSTAPNTGVRNTVAWMEQQSSYPAEAIQPVYAHSGWIPLAKDQDGNNIAIDLAPGPKGRVGQVILFGRDFDTKYVISPSWGDFLAQFAADLESGNSFIDDDIEEAVFAFKAPTGQLVSYFNVLRKRVERSESSKHPQSKQSQSQQQPRRSMTGAASVSALANSGRVTPRLVSPTGSSTSLPLKDSRARPRTNRSLSSQLNEVDLSAGDDTPNNKDKPASQDKPDSQDKSSRKDHRSVPVEPEFAVDSPAASPAKSKTQTKEVLEQERLAESKLTEHTETEGKSQAKEEVKKEESKAKETEAKATAIAKEETTEKTEEEAKEEAKDEAKDEAKEEAKEEAKKEESKEGKTGDKQTESVETDDELKPETVIEESESDAAKPKSSKKNKKSKNKNN